MRKLTKEVWGWALYDWANSAFITTIGSAVMPVFFASVAAVGRRTGKLAALVDDGTISSTIKGNRWGGPFHLPRMQLNCWKLLEEMIQKA